MNSNNLSESIKNDVKTILKTNDLISIKEILESIYKTLPNEYKSEYFDFIELFLIQEIKYNEIAKRTFVKQNNATPLLELAERQKQKRKFINKWLIDKKQNTLKQPEPEAIDLSNTTATEKIIYLHKLGVIDFLRKQEPFNYSINSLATVLSAVTGEKSGTIQPMLNPMFSEFNEQKNNPLNSKKAVPKVEQLIKIGFKLK